MNWNTVGLLRRVAIAITRLAMAVEASVSVFAEAEGLSRFEAMAKPSKGIAILTSVVPWESLRVRDRVLGLSCQPVSERLKVGSVGH